MGSAPLSRVSAPPQLRSSGSVGPQPIRRAPTAVSCVRSPSTFPPSLGPADVFVYSGVARARGREARQ